jgi:hypothetical protein
MVYQAGGAVMPDYEITSPSGQKFVVTAPEGATQEQVMAYAQQQFASQPPPPPGKRFADNVRAINKPQTWGQAAKNVAQGVAEAATGITGGFAGDVAGLGTLAADVATFGQFDLDPAGVRDRVRAATTYTPSDPNNLTSKMLQYPGTVFQDVGNSLANTGVVKSIPYAEHVVRAVPMGVATAMGAKASLPSQFSAKTPALVNGRSTQQTVKVDVPDKYVPPTIKGATPEDRAKAYVGSRTNLDWTTLPPAFRQKLSDIAAQAGKLENLDATAVERAAVLSGLDIPIKGTRGQITRDPIQQRNEQLVKATEAGKELRDIDIAQNKALLDNLDVLRGKTGGKASGDIETGRSVQDALRARKNREQVNVSKLYKEAEAAGEMQGPVNIDRLVEYLKNHDDPSQVAYAMSRLKQLGAIKEEATGGISVSTNRTLTLAELEGIRRAAGAAGKNGGTAGHYAKELKNVLDEVTEGVGGEKYQAARAARKALGDEFERQAAVARLVKNKGMTTDRAVALEDTWHKTVLSGSLEDLQKVRKSLGNSPNGTQAWADIQAATIDYIKARATGGKLGLKNEAGDLNTTWSGLRRAVDEIGPDKMREIFGEVGAKKIDNIVESSQLLKTEAPTGVKGSPTVDKFLSLLDRIPGVGSTASGVVQAGRKIKEMGQAGREVRKAQTSPLDD